jgi:hypothetical protein
MNAKKPSAGRIERPSYAPWNRSSAFSPEILGILTSITAYAVQDAIARFERAVDVSLLTEEQRAEATQMLIAGVTERMAQFTERLKSSPRWTLDCGTF